jgi:sodium-dependent dicarboxylate transporter 2/3/5
VTPITPVGEHVHEVGAISPTEAVLARWGRLAGVVLAPLGFAVTWFAVGDALEPTGRTLAAVLTTVFALWVTETLPLAVTALLGAVLCVVLGVAPARQVFAHFADPIVFLFIGSFMLARAMAVHGLDRRIALSFLAIPWVGARPSRLLGALGVVTMALSLWVSNTATAAMMLPISVGILAALHQARVAAGTASGTMNPRSWPFATGAMLMIAYAASIGGIGTPIGSPPNLIGIGLIRNSTGVDITFFTWMALALPMLAVMAGALFLLLMRLHPDTSAPPDEPGVRERRTRWWPSSWPCYCGPYPEFWQRWARENRLWPSGCRRGCRKRW